MLRAEGTAIRTEALLYLQHHAREIRKALAAGFVPA